MVLVKRILLTWLCLITVKAYCADSTRVLREYVAYTFPIDVRNTKSHSDWIVASAISTNLVTENKDGGLASDLADRWDFNLNEGFVEFHLHPGARWSDGSAITANDVVESFRQSAALPKSALPAAFATFSKFEAINNSTVRIHLASGVVARPDIISLVMDPVCAVLKIVNGKPSNKVTSGPFYIESASETEIVMKVNRFWHRYSPAMIDEIHLRRPKSGMTASTLIEDLWPNVVRLGNGVLKSDLAKLPSGIAKHQLNLSRVFGFQHGRRNDISSTRKLIGYLRGKFDRKSFAEQLDDAKPAVQISPPGVPLHLTQDPPLNIASERELLRTWKHPSIRVAYYRDNLPASIKLLVEKELKRILPLPVELVALHAGGKIEIHKYDLIFSTVGTDFPDYPGTFSYWFETEPVKIPSEPSGQFNFKARLEQVRKSNSDQLQGFRSIVNDVVENNYYLPIAWFSSEVIGKPNFDFSQITQFVDILPYELVRTKDPKVIHP